MVGDVVGSGERIVRSWLPSRSYGLKLLLVCMMSLAMTIPALFVFVINADRQGRSYEVLTEVSQMRGGEQALFGPMIVAPYEKVTETYVDGELRPLTVDALYAVHAETGRVVAQLQTEALHRAIYEVPVYTAQTTFTAEFDLAAARREAADLNVDWSRARIVLGSSDLRGARENTVIRLGSGEELALEPAGDLGYMGGGYQPMSAALPAAEARGRLDVEALLIFSGSQRFAVLPFAKSTDVQMSADWPHPSFDGSFLPDAREVGDAGFTAEWSIPYLARGMSGLGDAQQVGMSAFYGRDLGVRLVQQVDVYLSVGRALKYAVMFVGIVFLAFFLFEVASGRRVHAAQYVLIGLTQAVFYVLLLAFAEHLGFTLAFVTAAGLTVAAISSYAGSSFASAKYAVRAFVVFGVNYALLYLLLRQADYALLMGALTSFAALVAAMIMTRRVDWYGSSATR